MKTEHRKSIQIRKPLKLSLDIVSRFPFKRYQKDKKLPYLIPIYKGSFCLIYYGDFKFGTGPSTPTESSYISLSKLKVKLTDLNSVLEYIKSLKGYYKAPVSTPIEIKENQHGVTYSRIRFDYHGGRSYNYILLLKEQQIIISDAAWVDIESIKIN